MIHRVIIIVFRALILYRLRRFINHLLTYLLTFYQHAHGTVGSVAKKLPVSYDV